MATPRLSTALDQGLLEISPDARILCLGVSDGADLAGLPRDRLVLVQQSRPDHDRLVSDGYAPCAVLADADAGFDVALVEIPRARALARLWIARAAAALAPGGILIVNGARTDGIDSLYKATRAWLSGADSVTKAHGRMFWGSPQIGAFDAWDIPTETWPKVGGFVTGPGLFSTDHVDPGSAALAAHLSGAVYGQVADLGAGWGFLGSEILKNAKVAHLDVVEADHAALSAARINLDDPRAAFHWADATVWAPARPLDAVVMNPPFHTGRKPEPSLGRTFIASAARVLSDNGTLWMVANRHLPYEAALSSLFREVRDLPGTSAFKVVRASKPRR